jgi:uncharacterized protein (DUF362 family)
MAGCAPKPENERAVPDTATEPEVRATPTAPQPTATVTDVSATPAATATPAPTATVEAAETVAPTKPATTMVEEPVMGRVVRVRHAGVWRDDLLSPDALGEMLDGAVMALLGAQDAGAAWSALFSPDERVAIKVNAIRSAGYWTHAPLVMAVADRLQAVGIPPQHVVIFDRSTRELEDAGFPVNREGPGVRCYGTDGAYTAGWTLLDAGVGISDVLLACDALINIPLLKAHGISGMSFALKNHYGTFDQPARFHAPRIQQALGALNMLPPIADRTRLIIGDALSICTRGWNQAATGDAILMSRDPVAHDTVGLQLLSAAIEAEGGNPASNQARATPWLDHASTLGLGITEAESLDLLNLDL